MHYFCKSMSKSHGNPTCAAEHYSGPYRCTYNACKLISRDRPTKTGSPCLCRPLFYVAALSLRICKGSNEGWGGTISVEEIF